MYSVGAVGVEDILQVLFFDGGNCVENFYVSGGLVYQKFSVFFLNSAVVSCCSGSRMFIFAVCFSRIKLTVSCLRNLFRALVGHLSSFLNWSGFLRRIGSYVSTIRFCSAEILGVELSQVFHSSEKICCRFRCLAQRLVCGHFLTVGFPRSSRFRCPFPQFWFYRASECGFLRSRDVFFSGEWPRFS